MAWRMATRKNLSHDQRTREKIRTSQLVNRLEKSAFGEVELTTGQIKSIEILLKKALPDLSAITLSGTGDDGALAVQQITRRVIDSAHD